ncbi:MAG: DUF4159 domain-containing protein [Chitinophagales bacterium]
MKTTYRIYNLLFVLLVMFSSVVLAQNTTVKIGLLKYKGGGDWYANPTSLKNLASFCNKNLNMQLSTNIDEVEPGSSTLFNYSYIHITGHGNILFTDDEAENLRLYLIAGGFLHISDNYGIDPYIRKAMKKVFPELDFVELPASHPIYHQKYNFNNGLPKIHEHDNKPAKGFGLIYEGRLICFYDYESDLGDGWEDASVHKDVQKASINKHYKWVLILLVLFVHSNILT